MQVLYVPLPPPDGRVSILRALTRKTPLAPGTDLGAIGCSERCDGFSGAGESLSLLSLSLLTGIATQT
jgi:ribosome biogenesis ATPase